MPYFYDDGTEYFPDLVSTPDLCLNCKKHENPNEGDEILCNLQKIDYKRGGDFECQAYESINQS